VKKLTSLAPRVQLLLPAHNIPVAEPRELARVPPAMEEVRSGKIKGVPKDGKQEYFFTGFSFLMSK